MAIRPGLGRRSYAPRSIPEDCLREWNTNASASRPALFQANLHRSQRARHWLHWTKRCNLFGRARFAFPGQTEFFAARSEVANFAMLLTAGAITVALVTTHIPLREVPYAITKSEIVRVGKLLTNFLWTRGNHRPRIAVAGLNPHAGESGKLGTEEIERITPAIEQLRAAEREAEFDGPISPDTLFFHLVRGHWDAALCMYHDQGLIPLKLHGFDVGVNVTLGLPFPRTSPDHGTAFDIAGKNRARPDSMIAAINLAVELGGK